MYQGGSHGRKGSYSPMDEQETNEKGAMGRDLQVQADATCGPLPSSHPDILAVSFLHELRQCLDQCLGTRESAWNNMTYLRNAGEPARDMQESFNKRVASKHDHHERRQQTTTSEIGCCHYIIIYRRSFATTSSRISGQNTRRCSSHAKACMHVKVKCAGCEINMVLAR